MDEEKANYRGSWDGFWRDVASTTGEVFWDTEPSRAVERELPTFLDQMGPALPVLDVGCGNGRQTFALAGHFPRVIGVDISAEAIRGAQELYRRDNLEFRVLDLLADDEVVALHDDLGDVNLYVRAVLHQLRAEDLGAAVGALAALLGQRGKAFVVELSPAAEALFQTLASDPAGPPPKLARVFQHGIVPAALKAGEVPALFAAEGVSEVFKGEAAIVTTHQGPGGQPIEVPCDAWLFARV